MQVTAEDGKTKLVLVDQAVAFGGSIVVLAHLLKFLDRKRYSCVLVTAMPQEVLDSLFDPGIRTVRLKPTFDYRSRNALREKFRWLGPAGGRLAAYCFTAVSFTGNLVYRWKLRRLLRRERPQLVHVNNNCFFSAETCAVLGQRYIFHYHGLRDEPLPRWHRWVLSKAAAFISISDYITAIARRHNGLTFQPVRTIPNPSHAPQDLSADELLAVKHDWGIDPKATVVGIFGRLVSWKGQMEFLQAFQRAREEFPNTIALVVGDASDLGKEYEVRLRQWVADQGLESAVVFTGYIAKVAPLYEICDIVVHASIEPEPFGLVIVEAMSAGAAVIASPLGAAPEILEHGVTGLLADPRSTEQLVAALKSLLGNSQERQRIALAGKAHARTKYAPQRFAQSVDALYQEILSHRP